MPRMWVRRSGNFWAACASSRVSSCFGAPLENPSDQDPARGHSQLQEATDRINRILEELAQNPPDAGLRLALLALPHPDGEDRLQLSYIDTSVEVTTYLD